MAQHKAIIIQESLETISSSVNAAMGLAYEGLYRDGAHHKQWYLERILDVLGAPLPDPSGYDKGTPP